MTKNQLLLLFGFLPNLAFARGGGPGAIGGIISLFVLCYGVFWLWNNAKSYAEKNPENVRRIKFWGFWLIWLVIIFALSMLKFSRRSGIH